MKITEIKVAKDSSVYLVMYLTAADPSVTTIIIQNTPVQIPTHQRSSKICKEYYLKKLMIVN